MNDFVFSPYTPEFAADPYATFTAMRQRSPMFYDREWNVTFATRHSDISALLVHANLGRTMDHILAPEVLARQQSRTVWHDLPNYRRYISSNLLEQEGATHLRLRRLLVKGFTSAQLEKQRVHIERKAHALLDELMPLSTMDLLEDFVAPLTVHVIASLLGMPEHDQHLLRPWSAAIVKLYEKDLGADDLINAEQATTEFVAYLSDLIEARRAKPGTDLLSVLVQVEEEGEVLLSDELIATCILLLNAGHESTVNTAGNGLLALLRHPDQLAQLVNDPTLVSSAVEEMLRYDAPLQYFHRFVLTDMDYQGRTFKAGDTIGLLYGAGNRDPEVFDAPDQFDMTRTPGRHLAFGRGRHFCLGAPLARMELEIIFTSLLRAAPQLQLADPHPQFHQGLVFRGLKSLPLRW